MSLSYNEDRSWMRLPRHDPMYMENLKRFIDITFASKLSSEAVKCPCFRCQCIEYATQHTVKTHLFMRGFAECFIVEGQSSSSAAVVVNNEGGAPPDIGVPNEDAPPDDDVRNQVASPDNNEQAATQGFVVDNEEGKPSDNPAATRTMINSIIRGRIVGRIDEEPSNNEQPNAHTKIFLKLLEEAQKELYPCCTEATKVSFIVQLFQIKCMHGISNSALEAILILQSLVLPKGYCILDTIDKVRKVVRDPGLDYIKIHACENDCVLFWKENEELEACPLCK